MNIYILIRYECLDFLPLITSVSDKKITYIVAMFVNFAHFKHFSTNRKKIDVLAN